MKIIEHLHRDEVDYRNFLRIELVDDDGNLISELEFNDGEPEDSNLNRDFSDCWDIAKFTQDAVVECAARGETLTIEKIDHKGDWESFESGG